jgi:hypothetical protein
MSTMMRPERVMSGPWGMMTSAALYLVLEFWKQFSVQAAQYA